MHPDNFSVYTVSFQAFFVENSRNVWVNLTNCPASLLDNIESLSYATKITPLFSSVRFSSSSLELEAEPYGGHGLGANGGGGRVGNFKGVQLKGVGVTPLVGEMDNYYCKSGCYPLYEAMVESCYHSILNTLFQGFATDYYAVNYIGDSDYYLTAEQSSFFQEGKTKLSIGVRELAIRYSHFIDAYDYIPCENSIYTKNSDYYRVKLNCKRLYDSFPDIHSFIKFIDHCINSNAKRFAFSYVHQIAHGALTPSNLCLDGRWMDLTNSSFVPDGMDYKAGKSDPSFTQESAYYKSILVEFIYNINKFNKLSISVSALTTRYNDYFCYWKKYYSCSALGICPELISSPFLKEDREYLSNFVSKILKKKSGVVRGVPRSQPLAGGSFTSLLKIYKCLFENKLENDSEVVFSSAILNICNVIVSEYKKDSFSIDRWMIAKFFFHNFLKIYLLRNHFYIGNIYSSSRAIACGDNIQNYSRWVREYEYLSECLSIKNNSNFEVLMFRNECTNIIYSALGSCYKLYVCGFKEKNFSLLTDLLTYFKCNHSTDSAWNNHNFTNYFDNVVYYLNILEVDL